MYLGRIVEQGPTDAVLQDPQHAYTKLLLSAVPNPESGLRLEPLVRGDLHDDGASRLVEIKPGHFVKEVDMSSYRVGLMLYSVRDACAADLEGTLREVAALGYQGVEIFDLHGHSPATVAGWLDELDLVAIARHSRLEDIESRLPELAAEARDARLGSGSS